MNIFNKLTRGRLSITINFFLYQNYKKSIMINITSIFFYRQLRRIISCFYIIITYNQ